MKNVAEKLLAARAGGPVVSVADQTAQDLTLAQAYQVQALVVPETGDVGGWKVGAAGPQANPVWAPVFVRDILADGADLNRAKAAMIGIEVEIAFRVAGDADASSFDGPAPLQAFTAAHLVIEYVESRLERPADATDGWKLADNQINGGLVIGGAITDWRDVDTSSQHVRLTVDGKIMIDQVRDNPGGDPLRLLRWAGAQGTGHCGGLKAAQIITTGSLSGIQWYPAGTRIRAELPGLAVGVCLDL